MFSFKEWKTIYDVLNEERNDCVKMAGYYAEQATKPDAPDYASSRSKEYTDRLEAINGIIAKIEEVTF